MDKAVYLKALDLEIQSDIGNITIREYLRHLLETLWVEGEGFSGKRPFGNSGWQYYIYQELIEAEMIKGELDEEGCVVRFEEEPAQTFILGMIETIFKP